MESKFLTYSAIELAAEPAFQAWALEDHQASNWQSWEQQHPEQSAKLKEAHQILQTIKIKPVDTAGIDRAKLWSKIDQATPAAEALPVKQGRRVMLRWIAAAAAACIALLIFLPLLKNDSTEINTAFAVRETADLPDQSSVEINADSRLSFSAINWKNNRIVELEGEAFFKVQKGKTFTVKTAVGNVTVLGTSFNVYSRDGKFEVFCKTGKVSVRVNAQEQILIPGEQAFLDGNSLQKEILDSKSEIAWLAGVYRFKNSPLSEIMASIQRQYDYEIDLPADLRDLKFTGLYQTDNIEDAMHLITWPLNLKYTIEGKRIVIRK